MTSICLEKREEPRVENNSGMGTSLFGSARSGAVAASVMIWMVIASGAVFAQDEQKNDGLAEAKITGSQTAKVVQTAPAVQPEAAAQAPASPAPMVEAGNVTVNFKGADIKTVLAYISEVAGVDIVPAPDVSGTVDLKLTNKPWRTALDIIVRNYGFAYEREGDIIRVVTISKLKQEELTTQAFNLNYSKAKDVVASIKDIVGERGKVTYDDRTNTVIVTDIPTNIYKIGEIVSRLDKRTEQVLIEARILETILGDDEKLGIDWNLKITATGAQRPTTVPFNFLGKGNEYLNQFLPLSQVATSTAQGAGAGSTAVLVPPANFPANSNGEKSFPFAIKDNFTFGTLDFTEFQAVLEFLKERSNTDIISNPRIATLNNSPALINVGQTLNMPTYERNSTTGKMEVTGYEAKDLGILLQVTPHVNDNGEITIDLAPIISDLLRYDTLDRAAGIVAPVFSVRQAKTQVMIKDTQTIFIGGLIKENDIEIDNKVPFIGDLLGDIPYLGLLVNHKTTRKQKSELIFFITVNLMNSDKDIKNIPKASEAYVPIYTATTAPDPNPKKKLKTKQSL
jgi:type IV pilus assembly protein PilQ